MIPTALFLLALPPPSFSATTLTPTSTTLTPPTAVFGHNNIVGPIYVTPYDTPALIEGAKAMWSGQLRYPGGTVANYWHWPDSTYSELHQVNPKPRQPQR